MPRFDGLSALFEESSLHMCWKLLTPLFDPGLVVVASHDGADPHSSVARVRTEPVAGFARGLGPRDHEGIEYCVKLGDIMGVGSGYDEREQDSMDVT